MLVTENYSTKFMIMLFWASAPKSSAQNGIPKKSLDASLCSVVVVTTAQLHSTKFELRFCSGSNPALRVSEIYNGENL